MATSPLVDPNAPRVFLDSSVVISGSASRKGAAHALLVLCEIGLFRPVVCPYVIDEVERNLHKKLPESLARFKELEANIAWEIVPDPEIQNILPWVRVILAKDAPVLAAAIQAKPHRFITLDTKDFISATSDVSQQSGLVIATPGDLLREIRSILVRAFGQT